MGKRTAAQIARDNYNRAYRNYLRVEEDFYKGRATGDELYWAEKDYLSAQQTLEYVEREEALLGEQ